METLTRGCPAFGRVSPMCRHNSIIPFAGMETPALDLRGDMLHFLSQFNNPVRRDGNLAASWRSFHTAYAASQFNNPVRRDGNPNSKR